MTNKENEKKEKMAHLYMKILSAQVRSIPGQLARMLSVSAAVMAWLFCHSAMGVVVGIIAPQILVHLTFAVISKCTRSAYSWYITRGRYHEQAKYTENQNRQQQSESHSSSQQQSESHSNSRTQSDSNHNSGTQSGFGNSKKQEEQHSDSQHKESDKGSQHSDSKARNFSSAEKEAMRLFGLKETFTREELKKAWYRELKKCHPDQNVSSAQESVFLERTKRVNQAYKLLQKVAVN